MYYRNQNFLSCFNPEGWKNYWKATSVAYWAYRRFLKVSPVDLSFFAAQELVNSTTKFL